MLDLLKEDTLFLVLSCVWMSYFIVLGFNNTWKRLVATLLSREFCQGDLGKLLDMAFYTLTFFIIVKYFL